MSTNFFFKLHEAGDKSNGVGAIVNLNRFDVTHGLEHSQFISFELRDRVSDENLIIASMYINPTPDRSQDNLGTLAKAEDLIHMAIETGQGALIAGDFNNQIKWTRKTASKFKLYSTKFRSTRTSELSETDGIVSSMKIRFQKTDYRDFMSDHLCLQVSTDYGKNRFHCRTRLKLTRRKIDSITYEDYMRIFIENLDSWNWSLVRSLVIDRSRVASGHPYYSESLITY